MVAKTVSLEKYRNIALATLELSPGVNVLHGKNAQGKSNMLEAIYFFARGRSFRGAKEKELITFSEKYANMALTFQREGDEYPVTLEIGIPAEGRKQVKRGGAPLSGMREAMGSFRAVLFCPAHLQLVGGAPAVRRSFMDIALSQLYPAYLDSLSKYAKLVGQRTALLKDSRRARQDKAIWEVYAAQLANLGADITRRRMEYVQSLEGVVKEIFADMTDGRETPALKYRTSVFDEDGREQLHKLLVENIDREILVGSTLYGPHRDDIAIKLNDKDAKTFASQGQQRSLALAMKLAEGEMSKRIGGEYPVFLFDDVLSELDEERRAFLLSHLSGRQIIITACEADIFPLGESPDRVIEISEGEITSNEVIVNS